MTQSQIHYAYIFHLNSIFWCHKFKECGISDFWIVTVAWRLIHYHNTVKKITFCDFFL